MVYHVFQNLLETDAITSMNHKLLFVITPNKIVTIESHQALLAS